MPTTVTVTINCFRPDGTAISGALVKAVLTGVDVNGGYILPREVSAVANSSGIATMDLWPNSLGATETYYQFRIVDPSTNYISNISSAIPNYDCNLHEIAVLPPYDGKPDGMTVVEAAQDVLADCLTAQTAAELAETNAETAETNAETAAGTATTQAGIATTQAGIATTQAGIATTQAGTATTQAGTATAAAGTATTQAGIATTKAEEAAASALIAANAAVTAADDAASAAAPAIAPYISVAQAAVVEANAAADRAVAAWAASTAPAEQLAAIDTSFFPVTTLVTAKLFSTRNDYKGGKWRKQCRDKSWYTETIYGNQIGVGYYSSETIARAASAAGVSSTTVLSDNFSTYADSTALNAAWGTSASYTAGAATLSSGKMLLTATGTLGKSKSFATVIGRTYLLSFDKPASSVSAANSYVRISTAASGATGVIVDIGNTATSGTFNGVFTATATTTYVVAICVVTGTAEFDNITVKEYNAANAVTNDYYYDTTASLFKALNAGSGTTTIYRGGRREFPENFIVTVEAARVVIWDTDFGAPRMWMVFVTTVSPTAARNVWRSSRSATSVTARTGKILFGTSTDTCGLVVADFLKDDYTRYSTTVYGAGGLSLANRNAAVDAPVVPSMSLVNSAVNAVAITTLPNAPLDEYGIPKPTIQVGTDGGVTVLGWDGVQDNVAWDIVVTSYTYVRQVGFGADGRVVFTAGDASNNLWTVSGPVPTSDQSFANTALPTGYSSVYSSGDVDQNMALFAASNSTSAVKANPVAGNAKVRALNNTNSGLEIFRENPATPTKGMGAKITHTYNSGTLVGDIRRAWLADTTAETLTAATPLSEDFSDGNADGWSGVGATLAVVSGELEITNTGDAPGTATVTFFPTVVGETYVVGYTGRRGTSSTVDVQAISTSALLSNATLTNTSNVTSSFSFVATTTTSAVKLVVNQAVTGRTAYFDNITVKLAEPDRCVKNKALTVVGSLTKSAVASGANLVAYSGFSATNYLEEAYSSDLDFGTGDFCVMGWVTCNLANSSIVMHRTTSGNGGGLYISINGANGVIGGYASSSTSWVAITASTLALPSTGYHLLTLLRRSGVMYWYLDAESGGSFSNTTDLSFVNATTRIGNRQDSNVSGGVFGLSLMRISATAPTAEQIREIYEQEKKLFEPNAQCTLAGTSSAVLAVDHDDITGVTSVLTSYGRSDFKGLVRVASEATAVGTPKAVSALGGSILQVGSTGVDYYSPAKNLREELKDVTPEKHTFSFTATASQTAFPLPYGWRAVQERDGLWQNGTKKRFGTGNAWTQPFDGFIYTPTLATGATVSDWVSIEAERWL